MMNPAVGLFLQPVIGRWSDRLGRRTPFIVLLEATAIAGLLLLIAAAPVGRWLGLSTTMTVAAAFLGFGVADVSYDCLLIPGRALLDDATALADRDAANAQFTGFQLGGRLAALVLGALPITAGGFGVFRGPDAHFNAMLSASGVFLVAACSAAVSVATSSGTGADADAAGGGCGGVAALCAPAEPRAARQRDTERAEADAANARSRLASCAAAVLPAPPLLEPGEKALCAVQALGWMSICSQSFFWTAWRGEEAGCADLAAQSAVGVAVTLALPRLNRRFGASNVWCGAELLFHALMILTSQCGTAASAAPGGGSGAEGPAAAAATGLPPRGALGTGGPARLIAALSGITYAVHATNALLVAAAMADDPGRRAATIAMVNNTLPAGQLVVALLGGTLAQWLGGFRSVFAAFGSVGFAVTATIWWVAARNGTFDAAPANRRGAAV